MKLRVNIVDAFTEQRFKGNSAAVIITQDWLSDELMQSIATENNLSETAFLVKNSDDVFASLTAESELPDSALFNEFTLLFYQFLAQPAQRSQVLAFMQEHIQSLNWCESLIVNIMRMNQRWLKISENTVLDQQVLARLQQLTHDDIWQLQLLNNACKKQIMTLTQAS